MQRLHTWLVKDKVIFTSIIGELTVDGLPELDANIIELMDESSESTIHVFSDISMMTSMPNVFQMAKLKYITHPKIGFFVTQSRNALERFIGKSVGQMFNTKYKFVNSLEDGVTFLSQIDETLPPEAEMQAKIQQLRNEFINSVDALEQSTLLEA